MNLIEIIRDPVVACPETGETVLLCECERCQHFYGYNTGETKIGCKYIDCECRACNPKCPGNCEDCLREAWAWKQEEHDPRNDGW